MVLCTRAVQLGLQRPSRSGSGVEYDLLAYLDILILFLKNYINIFFVLMFIELISLFLFFYIFMFEA